MANKKALALLLKPASPTPSKMGSARSLQRDTERGTKVMRYCHNPVIVIGTNYSVLWNNFHITE